MADDKTLTKIPHFNGYYDHWSKLMENLLRAKGLWGIVERGIGEPVEGNLLTDRQRELLEEARTKDHQVKHYLFQALDREVFEQILDRSTAKVVWDSMKQKFGGNQKVKRSNCNALRREFEVIEMQKSDTIEDYFAKITQIANKLRSNGEEMTDTKIVEKILRTLTDKFTYICVSIEESTDTGNMTVDELQSTLSMHEKKFQRFQKEEEDQVLKVESRYGSSSRGRGRDSFRRGRGGGRQPFSKTTIECYKCHKMGHFQYECPTWKKEAHYTTVEEEEDDMLLMAQSEVSGKELSKVWFIDSGCSNHMCRSEELFTSLDKTFSHSVKLGNDTKLTVIGKGIVKIKLNNVTYSIGDVYFVPELKTNLLSVGQLQEKGLSIVFKNGKCCVFHPTRGEIVQTNMKANRMFMLISEVQICSDAEGGCLQATVRENTELWHQRLGHLNYKSLCNLQGKKMVTGMPEIKNDGLVCTHCLSGKQTRVSIPKEATWRASKPLELIHSDLCGPITPTSNSGKRYFLSFIDDYSRKCWIYLLSNKSDALEHFKYFKNMAENEIEAKLKCLRTDRGGEFNSEQFDQYCKDQGIKRHLTTTYTPQQNGVAERKNRTLMNMVRAMITTKNMPKKFWPEAVLWSCHVLNRCPTSSVEGMTPQEAWSGRKPGVDHLRVWGCLAHVHVPKLGRDKLDSRSKTCIFIGINEGTKGYRVFDVITEKVMISRDVVFEEDKQWNWEKKQADSKEDVLEWNDAADNEPTPQINPEVPPDAPQSDTSSDETSDGDSPDQGRAVTRLGRTVNQPAWMRDYVSGEVISDEEVHMVQDHDREDPHSYEDACKFEKWKEAMNNEMDSIKKNHTWSLVELPAGCKKIGVKWIFKTKTDEGGMITKHKARLVAKGYTQREGIDYTEVFAPVARMDTVRMILSTAACKGWKLYQLDVKSAFLQGEIEEDVYVDQPRGFEVKGKEHCVYKLHKALYGLKQAPRAWFSKIESHFVQNGFLNCESEQTLFTKKNEEGNIIIVSMYVDDLIFTGNSQEMMKEFKECMIKMFDMTDLGSMTYFLGIEVKQFKHGIFISQKKYAEEILRRFKMEECNSVSCPMTPGTIFEGEENEDKLIDETYYKQIVGSLMYLTTTRPDMMFSVSILSRSISRPTEHHLQLAKKVLRYLRGSSGFGIFYQKGIEGGELLSYTDSDFASDKRDRKSTSGYVFMISGGAVAWSSKKQPIVTLSTTEAEFIAAAVCACQAIWMKRVLTEIEHSVSTCTQILCDNSSTIKLSKNPVMHGRSKHIDIRFHFLRNLSKEGSIELSFCGTHDQLADIMTKPLKKDTFIKFRTDLGMCTEEEVIRTRNCSD
ncbi:transmembrane signal receptor [Lithospermum erythrorhizon]|uniref:Transmembrane signal receptor n=1 Tax=Lithospermum erythrorhizon TaxID=34254 RepID=A0AAV3RCU3_LITER